MGRGSRAQQRKEAAREEEVRRLCEASTLRKEAVATFRLDREGRHDEAIARAEGLAAKHRESAPVLHLAAGLHHNAYTRAAADGSDSKDMAMHLAYARDFYMQAARLAPNCLQIATGLAMARLVSPKDYEPDREIIRAVNIDFPIDPAENNVAFDLDRIGSTAMERVAKAREAALLRHRQIMSHMSTTVIPRAVVDVLDISKREGAAKANKQAKELAARFDYSARAHLTRAYISLQFARCLAPDIDKKPFLNRILDVLNEVVDQFRFSLEIAMFLAKLWFILEMYDHVESECNRAIGMKQPTDPREEDVPPGSVPGEKPEDRKSFICRELERLLQKLVLAARDYWCSLSSEKQDRFRLVGLKSLHQHYVNFYEDDQEAAKTTSDALNFVKKNRSWRFWICPYCVGKKIPDTNSLLQHMRNKHPEGNFWPKLLSVLDPKLISNTSQGDYFLDNDHLIKCMTEDKRAANKSIDGAVIDAVFPFVDVFPDIDAIFPNVDDAPDSNDADTSTTVTYGQSAEQIASATSYHCVDVLNKENTDKDLFILHVIIQSLWNSRCFRDEFLRAPPARILHINENYCIADLFYGIFSAWEKNEHNGVDVLLTSVKANLCKIANDNMFHKTGKNFASGVVATILQGLHMSETPLHFDFNSEIEELEVKSFADLPVLYDDQSCFEDNCEHCGSMKNVDVSPSSTSHFFTIGLDWFGDSENQVQLSEVLASIANPLNIKLLCKGVHSSANYCLVSMISYADGRYICFARDQDKWLICDAETVEAEDSWEQLLEHFKDCRLQPEVLFFEVIK
ncbi:hypothetical protein E2562_015505 [Oryza meyeriana var. granulata]|uniref:DUF629 domain-containing protein n=1 Tax=Oryza meyeriana var. granulata TaxID=110450 RepID=A0A6G1CQA2_9ORYZ|nr:hypothetical protein E2562_015505 [Oryza meyeriana var. granulata]